jgi:two-component system, OmpR family, response regulator
VLVVEDDTAFSELLRNLMSLHGFQPRIARNRAEVIAGLAQVPSPDLVLLDVRLPDANGFDILLRMKQHPSLKTIPVVMLTGEATREAVMQGLAGGADGYVTKPFELESLLNAVGSVLGLS